MTAELLEGAFTYTTGRSHYIVIRYTPSYEARRERKSYQRQLPILERGPSTWHSMHGRLQELPWLQATSQAKESSH